MCRIIISPFRGDKPFVLLSFLLLLSALTAGAQSVVWHDPASEPFDAVSGRGWSEELKGTYGRFPGRFEGKVPEAVWHLSRQSAGLYLKFRTDSPVITVRYGVTGGIQMQHMPATGVSGVDLYSLDSGGVLRWYGAGNRMSFKDTVTYTYNDLSYRSEGGYEFTLYLPLYNHVEWMEVGTEPGKSFGFVPADCSKPVVVYGTSIAQGACATRPGMAWTNILQRMLHKDVVNLGFSGSGQMEPEVFSALAELDAGAFVIDCMANMDHQRNALIYPRTMDGVHILRAASDAPIILVEHAGCPNTATSENREENVRRCNAELSRAYRALLEEGVTGLYLIPHSENAYSLDEMVEGWHPNDIGMQHQAAVTEKFLLLASPAGKR